MAVITIQFIELHQLNNYIKQHNSIASAVFTCKIFD